MMISSNPFFSKKENQIIKELRDPTRAYKAAERITDHMRNDYFFIRSALQSVAALNDTSFIRSFINSLISDSQKKNDVHMKFFVDDCPLALSEASDDLCDNRKVVLKAVKKDGRALEFASEELRSDPEVVEAAVKNYPPAFIHALGAIGERLRSDKEVVLAAAEIDMQTLNYASLNLRRDPDILSICMKQDWQKTLYILRRSYTTHFADLCQQLRKDPRLARYFEMNDTLEKLRDKEIKLDEINEKYFTDRTFYNEVVEIMKDMIMDRFGVLTQDMSQQEMLDPKLQKTLNKRIEQMCKKLESKRNLVKFKQKVNHILHKDKASDLDKDLDDLGV